jgi:tRNA (guanine37-N1)-methyltransferase
VRGKEGPSRNSSSEPLHVVRFFARNALLQVGIRHAKGLFFLPKNGMMTGMKFHVVTLFPEAFDSYLKESIIGRAIKQKNISVAFYDPRKFAPKELKKKWPDGNVTVYADGKPYGGGPGMVLRAEPYIKAIEKALATIAKRKTPSLTLPLSKRKGTAPKVKIVFFSPGGKMFDTGYAKDTVKKYTDIIFVCGRYEGIDARIRKIFKMEDISIGDYVLTGGELPAMICIDCMARQIPGVLGNFDSREEERVSSHDVYTRPEILEYKGKKYKVPPVLLSGDPKKIDAWKNEQK